jgi:hypothetical protein
MFDFEYEISLRFREVGWEEDFLAESSKDLVELRRRGFSERRHRA